MVWSITKTARIVSLGNYMTADTHKQYTSSKLGTAWIPLAFSQHPLPTDIQGGHKCPGPSWTGAKQRSLPSLAWVSRLPPCRGIHHTHPLRTHRVSGAKGFNFKYLTSQTLQMIPNVFSFLQGNNQKTFSEGLWKFTCLVI